MGFLDRIKMATYTFRYGEQIGKTSANGRMAFKRGNVVTGLNKDGDVISVIKTKTQGNTTFVNVRKPCVDRYGNDKNSHRITEITRTKEGNELSYESVSYKEGYENRRPFKISLTARYKKEFGQETPDNPHLGVESVDYIHWL